MFFLLSQAIEFFSTAAVLIPFFLLLQIICFRRVSHTLWCYILAVYWGMIYVLTGLPTVQFFTFDPLFYLIPFAGFFNDLANSILNILLFVPMGLLVPLLCEECRNFRSVLLIGFLCSLGIEFFQIYTYRVTDINDLITNTIGAALGYFLFTKLPLTIKTRLSTRELLAAAAATLPAMFFFQQALASHIFILIF